MASKANEKRIAVTLECTSLQAPQLHHREEQGERPRAHRDEEVLPVGPQHTLHKETRCTDRGNRIAPSGQVRTVRHATNETGHGRAGRSPPATGDQEAFEELVRATYADTYTLAYRLTGDEEDARDVVQESYLRAFRGLKRFRGDAQFTTWLYRITANCAPPTWASAAAPPRGAARRRRRSPTSTPSATPRPGPTPRCCATASRTPSRDLPPKLRAVVVLRDVYDLPHEAIAAELGHLRVGGQGPPAPGPPQAPRDVFPGRPARPTTTRRYRRCGVTSSPTCSPAVADGTRHRRPRRPPPRRALPALPGRARPVPQAAAGPAHPAHRGARAGARAAAGHPRPPRGGGRAPRHPRRC